MYTSNGNMGVTIRCRLRATAVPLAAGLLNYVWVSTTEENEGWPESIQPFWISGEPVGWLSCNLAASKMRPYCAFVNSHSLVGLVSRQWDAVDCACVLCDCRIHKSTNFQRRFQLWEKSEVAGSQIWAVGGLTDLGDDSLPKKKPAREL
jgi:hypothetical protein